MNPKNWFSTILKTSQSRLFRRLFLVLFAAIYIVPLAILACLGVIGAGDFDPASFDGILWVTSLGVISILSVLIFLLSHRRMYYQIIFIASAVAWVVLAFSAIYERIQWAYFTPHWSAIYYTMYNRAENPNEKSSYWSREECVLDAQRKMGSGMRFIADGDSQLAIIQFFCGRDCFTESDESTIGLDEIMCEEGAPSPAHNHENESI